MSTPGSGVVRAAAAGALAAVLLAVCAPDAAAGEFQVATCQADSLSFSTRAFDDFATRGMKIRRACNPEGPGLRGLITANVIDRGRVPRGAVALATITAPPGTRMTTLRWAGTARRRDCRYALQLYAEAPDIEPIAIKNVRANRRCPGAERAQASGYRAQTYDVAGATRIVQRVICVGDRDQRSCSARGRNYIRTYKASVGIADSVPPAVAILEDTPLATGAWVGGAQVLNYTASDHVGVRSARALIAGLQRGSDNRTCLVAAVSGAFADSVPCPSGPGQISLQTRGIAEGSQELVVDAQDPAGNVAVSGAVIARIDNTPPERVDTAVEGGERWRNRNEWQVEWVNAIEGDRAPIVAANYALCRAPGACDRSAVGALGVARLTVAVPSPGEWTLSLWRRDAAGNEAEDNASVPVTLRYDPEPPRLAFEPPAPADPTLVAVRVIDEVSGLADGGIEISRAGSGVWQALVAQTDGSRLVARIDDATLSPGSYVLRARARDQANNEGSTDRREDGQPMAVTLPLRIRSTIQAGFERAKLVTTTIRRHGKRRRVRRRVIVLRPSARVEIGQRAQIAGRVFTSDGQGIAGAAVQVLSRTEAGAEQLVATFATKGDGRFHYATTAASSRTLWLSFGGSPLILPSQRDVQLRVPAATSVRVSRARVLNGQAVKFSGRVRGLPVPTGGKLVEVQVLLSGHWQTFRTISSDEAGRWTSRYRFRRTRGVLRYRFRARLPRQSDYPFETGTSRTLAVEVTGR